MATIERRVIGKDKVTYRAKVRLRGHAPVSRTFERKRDAEKWARTGHKTPSMLIREQPPESRGVGAQTG